MLAQEPHPSGDRGWIINVTSVHGFVGTAGGATPYVASKGAIVAMTKALALEYANDRMSVQYYVSKRFMELQLTLKLGPDTSTASRQDMSSLPWLAFTSTPTAAILCSAQITSSLHKSILLALDWGHLKKLHGEQCSWLRMMLPL